MLLLVCECCVERLCCCAELMRGISTLTGLGATPLLLTTVCPADAVLTLICIVESTPKALNRADGSKSGRSVY